LILVKVRNKHLVFFKKWRNVVVKVTDRCKFTSVFELILKIMRVVYT